MSFEPNVGQAKASTQFVARGGGYTVQLTPSGPMLAVKEGAKHLAISFPGGRASKPEPENGLPGKVNYFLAKDRKDWHANVPTYGQVRYRSVYAGIDIVYYGTQRMLEYDFVVAPGADPTAIRLHFDGAGKPSLNTSGDLQFKGADAFTQHQPLAYQEHDGVRTKVGARYRMLANSDVALDLDPYDHTRSLTVDPTLSYASFLGGNDNDGILAMQVDSTGSLYIAGWTASANFQTKAGAPQATYGGRVINQSYFGFGDAFLAKLNPAGTAFVYCTYLGGSQDDLATGLAIDSTGAAYVVGGTQSSNFPTTAGAYQTRFGGGVSDFIYERGDAFVTKLSPAGDRIVWSTYVGGTNNELAWAVALDSSNNVAIVGETLSTDFPTTANAVSRAYRGGANYATNLTGDGFVAQLNSTGTTLMYASYLGGRSNDMARAVAVDANGAIFVAGGTFSSDFPTTVGAFKTKGGVVETTSNYDASADDGYVLKINKSGALDYSTYLGGSYRDTVFGLAVDPAGNAYVTGRTRSTDFPVTANAIQKKYGGDGGVGSAGDAWDGDVFVAKLNPTGTALIYATYVGGTGDEEGSNIVIDSSGNAYIAGYSLSSEFPVTADAMQKKFAGFGGQGLDTGGPPPDGVVNTGDAFLMKLDPNGALLYSSFFGGSKDDIATALAIDSARNIYLGGVTLSPDLLTSSAIQSTYGGQGSVFPRGDAFFAKFDFGGKLAATPARVTFTTDSATTGTAGSVLTSAVAVVDASGAAIAGIPVSFAATNATLNNSSVITDSTGKASVQVTLGTASSTTITATVAGLAPVSLSITVQPAVAGLTITTVLNGASFLAPLAPGSWMTIAGTSFAAVATSATNVPLPLLLGGIGVKVNGIDTPLLFVNGTQINAQLPYEIAAGNATVVVTANGVASAPFAIKVQATAPGIFLYSGTRAVAQNLADDGSVTLNTTTNAVTPGKLMIVYFTGQGALDNVVPTGSIAGSSVLSRPIAGGSVTVGGKPATVGFLGMTPGSISLGQANIQIPDLDAGDYPVVITIGGQASNAAAITVGARK